jgi:tRNA-modifying protein YgfZ
VVNAMQRIPTFDWHQQKGAVFENYFGCEIPSHYGNYEQEYWLLRKSAGVRDVSYFGKIKVTGRDRQRFLNGMLTNEIKALENGKGALALFLDVKGHIQADLKVYIFSDHLLMILQHYLVEKLMAGLDRYIMSEDVRMQDVSAEYTMFQVLGPQAEAYLLGKGITPLPQEPYSFCNANISSTASLNATLAQSLQIIRLPFGFALLSSASAGPDLLEFLNGPLVGAKAFEVLRVESGLPLMHRDMDESNFPQESGLNAALNFQKGCYLGQETMARIDAQGHVNRHLIGVSSSASLHAGDKLFKDSKEIGKITSATHSLLLQQPFAIGYIRREFDKDGESILAGDDSTIAIIRHLPLKG